MKATIALAPAILMMLAVACGSSKSGSSDSDQVASTNFALSGGDFAGNSVRICGSRPPPDSKFRCNSSLSSPDAGPEDCPCFNFAADGSLIDPATGGPLVINGLCPSVDFPPADWTFTYSVFTEQNCAGTQLNDGNHNFTCFDSHDIGSMMFPNESVEALNPGLNTNHILCTTENASKQFNFESCAVATTPADTAAGATRFDCGCTPTGTGTCDCGPGGVGPGDLESNCSFDPVSCDIVCGAVPPPPPVPTVLAWGDNSRDMVGAGCTADICPTPVPVPGLPPADSVTMISGAISHSLALTASDHVWAWGDNVFSQLGNDPTDTGIFRSALPLLIQDLPPVVQISGGGQFSLTRTASGQVWGWGRNDRGQLGDGTTVISRSTPVQAMFPTVSPVVQVVACLGHCLARTVDRQEFAWGTNNFGQLGDGTTTNRSTPVEVIGLPADVTAVACGQSANFSFALTASDQVWAWGSNNFGQLGDGTTVDRHTPVQTVGLPAGDPVVAISAGFTHTLALTASGEVWAWGFNINGQLGDGTTTERHTPVRTVGLPDGDPVTQIAAGADFSLALTASGHVWGWGINELGQLGTGNVIDKILIPVQTAIPPNDLPITEIAAGSGQGLALSPPHR
jgi:alpha-tubulin suppressor-like RCC1 family protein